MRSFPVFVISFVACIGPAWAKIHDPLNIFCGAKNCYDILGVERTAPLKEIKKAYRQLSLTEHPDKNRHENATAVFQKITKAFEVVTGNESRPLFDYYLDHPTDYFKVSGQHYMRNIPHSDARIVITIALLLFSWLLYTIQYQKYQRAVKFLKTAAMENSGPKNGGTKETQVLYRKAVDLYQGHMKEVNGEKNDKNSRGKSTKNSGVKTGKMSKDPLFEKFIDQVVAEVKIEGGYRKPVWQDLLIVQLVRLPYTLTIMAQKYHRRYISKAPLPLEDRIEMTREKFSQRDWDDFSAEEREALVEREVWKPDIFAAWCKEQDEREEERVLKGLKGKARKIARMKLMRARQGYVDSGDDFEYSDDDYAD